MNLLEEGLEQNKVIRTGKTKELLIGGVKTVYDVYKIDLDVLYYNDQNDRIATWINEYKILNNININQLKNENIREYNNKIHEFITNSNKDALKKTQKNIELIGQQEYGVVLLDGRIIDGNRRFTCLRNIEYEKSLPQKFEAVILKHNIENNAKQIKMLELMLQHGIDKIVDYNPIDRLVGIYNDIIDLKLLTIKEYAKSIDQSEKELEIEVKKAKLLEEFLEFINAPKQFYIARTMNLNDPLKELLKILNSSKSDDEKEDIKNIIFSQFLIQPEGDMTRYIRKIKKIFDNNKIKQKYIESNEEIVEKVLNEVEKFEKITPKEINLIKGKEELKVSFHNSTEKYLAQVEGDIVKNAPIKQIERAYDNLDIIDREVLLRISKDKKIEILEKLEELEKFIDVLKEDLNV